MARRRRPQIITQQVYPWPRPLLAARLDDWAIGEVAHYAEWLDGTATATDPVGEVILLLPLLWRAVLLQHHVVGETLDEATDKIRGQGTRPMDALHRSYAMVHGYLLAADPTYREAIRAYERRDIDRRHRVTRAGPVDPAAG